MLSLEEFLKLPAEEKTKRYLELSEKDRFLARTSDWQPKDTVVVKYSNLKSDQEKQEEFIKQLNEALERDELNLLNSLIFLLIHLIAQGSCRNVRAFCYTQICPGYGVKL
ncbi:MAG: hypothetical protein ACLT1K_06545 [[Clostridium] leptum]